MALTPPPAAPQRGDRTTFASRVDVFITWLINFVTELVALVGNLNSIAAGGAYAIPFTLRVSLLQVGGSSGALVPDGGATQSATTRLAFDQVDSAGSLLRSRLDSVFATGNTSALKGSVRLVKQNDPSRWLVFQVASWVFHPEVPYGELLGTCIAASSANPFTDGDVILMQCQRTGDKGDSGALTPVLWVRDEKVSGTSGGASTAGATVQRVLNAVKKNTISGASLSGNQVALPAGTYRMNMAVPCYSVGGTQAWLYNVTDGAVQIAGSTEYNVKSTVVGAEFTISAAKVFEVRHYATASNATGLGLASSSGQAEVYTELFIEKVS